MDPYIYEFSDIDNQQNERKGLDEKTDFFNLFQFSAKWDPIPTMLTQNHETASRVSWAKRLPLRANW
jgi:hypothetical protein